MSHRAAKWCTQSSNRRDICWPLRCDGAGDNPSQTVADKMDFPAGPAKGFLNRFIQLLSNQEVRTLRVEPDAGKEWYITDSREPLMQWSQVSVRAEKSRD